MYPGWYSDVEYLEGFRDDGDENVEQLDPLLVFRLASAYRDSPYLREHLTIESAARTRAEQDYLYAGWVARRPGYNLAASPDRIIGRHRGTTWRGSYHQVQETGWAYAVDLTHHMRGSWDECHKRLRAWGIHQTVQGEPWHHAAQTIRGPFPGPTPVWETLTPDAKDDDMTPELEDRLDDLQTNLATWVWNGHIAETQKLDRIIELLEKVAAK